LRTGADFYDKRRSGTLQSVNVKPYIDPEAAYQTSFLSQYATLTRRNYLRQRDRYLSINWLTQTLIGAVAVGIVWFQLPRTEATARDRFGLVSSLRVITGPPTHSL